MNHTTLSHVLQLDIQGTPQAWISLEQAASHVARGAVAWVDGEGPLATLRGGKVALGGKVLPKPRTYQAAREGVVVVPQGRRIVANLNRRALFRYEA